MHATSPVQEAGQDQEEQPQDRALPPHLAELVPGGVDHAALAARIDRLRTGTACHSCLKDTNTVVALRGDPYFLARGISRLTGRHPEEVAVAVFETSIGALAAATYSETDRRTYVLRLCAGCAAPKTRARLVVEGEAMSLWRQADCDPDAEMASAIDRLHAELKVLALRDHKRRNSRNSELAARKDAMVPTRLARQHEALRDEYEVLESATDDLPRYSPELLRVLRQMVAVQKRWNALTERILSALDTSPTPACGLQGRGLDARVRRVRTRSRESGARARRRRVAASASSSSDGSRSSGDGDPPPLRRHPRYGLVNDRLGRLLDACCVSCGHELVGRDDGSFVCPDPSCFRWRVPV